MNKAIRPLQQLWQRSNHVPKKNSWKLKFNQQSCHIHTSFCLLDSVNPTKQIFISDACAKQIKKVASSDEFLRVIVEGGGCSGFQYKFELDKNTDHDDRMFEHAGIKVVADKMSLELLNGSTVDYEEEIIKSSFRIKDNPRSKTSCSCGVSFSIDL